MISVHRKLLESRDCILFIIFNVWVLIYLANIRQLSFNSSVLPPSMWTEFSFFSTVFLFSYFVPLSWNSNPDNTNQRLAFFFFYGLNYYKCFRPPLLTTLPYPCLPFPLAITTLLSVSVGYASTRSVQKVSSHVIWKIFIEEPRNIAHSTVTPQSPSK